MFSRKQSFLCNWKGNRKPDIPVFDTSCITEDTGDIVVVWASMAIEVDNTVETSSQVLHADETDSILDVNVVVTSKGLIFVIVPLKKKSAAGELMNWNIFIGVES